MVYECSLRDNPFCLSQDILGSRKYECVLPMFKTIVGDSFDLCQPHALKNSLAVKVRFRRDHEMLRSTSKHFHCSIPY